MDSIRRIHVKGLQGKTTKNSLKAYFSGFGEVQYARVGIDEISGRSRGFAFVKFVDPEVAAQVLGQKEHTVDGKRVVVQRAFRDPRKNINRARKRRVGVKVSAASSSINQPQSGRVAAPSQLNRPHNQNYTNSGATTLDDQMQYWQTPAIGTTTSGAVLEGQPPIRPNMYEIGRQDYYFNTSINSGWYGPIPIPSTVPGMQQAGWTGGGGIGGNGMGVYHNSTSMVPSSAYPNYFGQGYYNYNFMMPSGPPRNVCTNYEDGNVGDATTMHNNARWSVLQQGIVIGSGYSIMEQPSGPNAADYGYINIGGMGHPHAPRLMLPSGPPHAPQPTASYECGNVADATRRHNNNEPL